MTLTREARSNLTLSLKSFAKDIGFDLVGVAPAVSPTGINHLLDWLEAGFAGEMGYIECRESAYHHPEHVLPAVQSVVMVGLNYKTDEPRSTDSGQGRIARYAWGESDYHDVIRGMLKQLAGHLHEAVPGCRTRGVVDTAPLLERDFARLAGLGWFGKNTMLINKRKGSLLFLGALLTDVELESDQPHESAHCGTCTACLDACPTDAFPQPYVLDARKCISYLTIELRDQPVPNELREPTGNWLFGCDICQDVCPWNRKAPASGVATFQPLDDANPMSAAELLEMDDAQFRKRFKGTPMERTGRAALLRNAAIVLGNSGDNRFKDLLTRGLGDCEELIRDACQWALGRLS